MNRYLMPNKNDHQHPQNIQHICLSEYYKSGAPINGSGRSSANDISEILSKLPKFKAKAGFEKRMTALFALELENEIQVKNSEWLKRKKGIKLPLLISDIRKEFT